MRAEPTRDHFKQLRIPAVWMRGGTSKGLFFHAHDLPADAGTRDRLLLRAIGSPDAYGRQIDGLGGATSSTSKVAIIQPSARPDCDVEYWFGHVAIDRALIDWSGNCGNLSAAVGPFAIEEGLVAAQPDLTTVRVWQANTSKRFLVEVATADGEVRVDGETTIAGVSGSGAPIHLRYPNPGGGGGRPLLPSGRPRDRLRLADGSEITASLINAGNPTVFVAAGDLGLTARELASEVDTNPGLLEKLEAIRVAGALAMGLGTDATRISQQQPGVPKVAWIAPAADYATNGGAIITAEEIDLLVRIMSLGRLHHAITGTGAIALGVACTVTGTLAHDLCAGLTPGAHLRIGHSSGIMPIQVHSHHDGERWVVEEVVLLRTARRLMEGWVRVPASAARSGSSPDSSSGYTASMSRETLIELLLYPREFVTATVRTEACDHGWHFSSQHGECQHCWHNLACDWLQHNDDCIDWRARSNDDLIAALESALGQVDAHLLDNGHDRRRCRCDTCSWYRRAQSAFTEMTDKL